MPLDIEVSLSAVAIRKSNTTTAFNAIPCVGCPEARTEGTTPTHQNDEWVSSVLPLLGSAPPRFRPCRWPMRWTRAPQVSADCTASTRLRGNHRHGTARWATAERPFDRSMTRDPNARSHISAGLHGILHHPASLHLFRRRSLLENRGCLKVQHAPFFGPWFSPPLTHRASAPWAPG